MPTMQEFCEFIDASLIYRNTPVETRVKMFLPYMDHADLANCSSKLLLCNAGEETDIFRNFPRDNTLNLVICGASSQTGYSVPDEPNLNIAVSLLPIHHVGNIFTKVFNHYTQFKEAFDLVLSSQGGVHEIITEAVRLTRGEITIHLFSNTFTLIESCGPEVMNSFHSASTTNGALSEFMQRLVSGKDSSGNVVTPVTGSSGPLAYMLINHKDGANVPVLFRSMLARRLSAVLSSSYMIYTKEQRELQKLISDILVFIPGDPDPLYKRLKALPYPLASHIRYLIISRLDKSAPVWPMCSDLESLLPRHNITIIEDYVIAIVSGDNLHFRADIDEKQFEAFLKRYDAYALFTLPSKFVRALKTVHAQARELLPKIPQLIDISQKRFIYFEDILDYYRVHLCSTALKQLLGNDKLIYLAHPIAMEMLEYDVIHKTDYFEFIVEYSNCAGNIQETASRTHMHRNSAYNKLNKAIELFGMNFSDGHLQRDLIFSMNVFKYNGLKPKDMVIFSDPYSKTV